MAVSMFWLACKLEEVIDIDDPNKSRLRDVLVMFYHVTRKVRYGIPDGGLLDIFSLVREERWCTGLLDFFGAAMAVD